MAATSKTDLAINGAVTRLSDIDTNNTAYDGTAYKTDVTTCERGLKFPNEVTDDKRPALYTERLTPILFKWLPGGRREARFDLVTHGYISRRNKTAAQIRTAADDLRNDVILAYAEDFTLGGTCCMCTPKDGDGSEGRPTDARGDGWITVVAEVLLFLGRGEH